MIISRITGGIGNQLFIYAASRRLALKNNIDLVLDNISGFTYDKNFKRNYQLDHFNIPCRIATATERLEPFSRVRRYLKRIINKKLPINKKSYILEEGRNFETQLLNFHPKRLIYLEGYFQSENFFKDAELIIKEDLIIRPPNDNKNLSMLKKIQNKNSIAIHIRFFDKNIIALNQKLKNITNTSIDYYKKAIKKMNEYFSNAHYFVFSNQPKEINNYLFLDKNQVTIVDQNYSDSMAYADLWLMSNCQHFIIAKSTFSWWGAWLSNNKKKIIIAPKIEGDKHAEWSNKSLLPNTWIQV
jgi:hypothetical protein